MARLDNILGKFKYLPICFNENFLAATAGTGTDFEYPLMAVPTLNSAGAVSAAFLPSDRVQLKSVMIVPSAAITGAATNNFTLNVNWWRNGAKVQAAAIASITFSSGVNGVIHSPLMLYPKDVNGNPVVLLPGDSITIARVSAGTGLASPLFIAVADYTAAGAQE